MRHDINGNLCYWAQVFCQITALLMVVINVNAGQASRASEIFSEMQDKVFQIRVVDIGSGDKTSIGSGFSIDENGYLATNHHVVARFVQKPERYRLEYIDYQGRTGDVELVDIDVVNDLAVLKIDMKDYGHFVLGNNVSAQGERIYSMGNPHDLGMTIIEGNFNGYIKASRYRKILFSGSLNGGMSGGPALNNMGEVIGINVSKGGEQLSFLVPVEKLKKLYERALGRKGKVDFMAVMKADLLKDQQSFYKQLFEKEWKEERFVKLMLPGSLHLSIKCWGDTDDDPDLRYNYIYQNCETQDTIYIYSDHYTGVLAYQYDWIDSEALNTIQFYNLLQDYFYHMDVDTAYEEEDVTKYSCTTRFVELDDTRWRASTCVREYKKLRGIFDLQFVIASLDIEKQALVLSLSAAGIDKNNIELLLRKIMGSIKWIN